MILGKDRLAAAYIANSLLAMTNQPTAVDKIALGFAADVCDRKIRLASDLEIE
ncbi:MAG TPA: hypothetical protein VIX19_01145 [Terriglobales bacterium]